MSKLLFYLMFCEANSNLVPEFINETSNFSCLYFHCLYSFQTDCCWFTLSIQNNHFQGKMVRNALKVGIIIEIIHKLSGLLKVQFLGMFMGKFKLILKCLTRIILKKVKPQVEVYN